MCIRDSFGGEEGVNAGVGKALVAKDWSLLSIERMGLPVTNEMRDARVKVLQDKGCSREAILREGLSVPFEGHRGTVWSVCVTADGQFVVTGSHDNIARIWRLADGSHVRSLEGHGGSVYSVCVTADGQFVVTGSHDKSARMWGL